MHNSVHIHTASDTQVLSMEKSFYTDSEEWELLPATHNTIIHFGFGSAVDMNYFANDKNSARDINQKKEDAIVQRKISNEVGVEFKDIDIFPKNIVYRNKLKDDEFVNKIEFPKIFSNGIIMPPGEPEPVLFDGEEEDMLFYKDEMNLEKEFEIKRKQSFGEGFELKIWRWTVVGSARSLCSLGVAAVTMCIFILGQGQVRKNHHGSKKIQIQIYRHGKKAPRRNQAFLYDEGCSMDEDH